MHVMVDIHIANKNLHKVDRAIVDEYKRQCMAIVYYAAILLQRTAQDVS